MPSAGVTRRTAEQECPHFLSLPPAGPSSWSSHRGEVAPDCLRLPFGLASWLLAYFQTLPDGALPLHPVQRLSLSAAPGTLCALWFLSHAGRASLTWVTSVLTAPVVGTAEFLTVLGRRQSRSWGSPSGNLAFVASGHHLTRRPLIPQCTHFASACWCWEAPWLLGLRRVEGGRSEGPRSCLCSPQNTHGGTHTLKWL